MIFFGYLFIMPSSADNTSREEKLNIILLTSAFANWHCLNVSMLRSETEIGSVSTLPPSCSGLKCRTAFGNDMNKIRKQKKKGQEKCCAAGLQDFHLSGALRRRFLPQLPSPKPLDPTTSSSTSCWLPGASEKQSWKRLFHVFVGRRLRENRKSLRSSTCGGTWAPSQQPQFRETASGLSRRRRRSGRWGGGKMSHAVLLAHAEHWNRDGSCWRNHRRRTAATLQMFSTPGRRNVLPQLNHLRPREEGERGGGRAAPWWKKSGFWQFGQQLNVNFATEYLNINIYKYHFSPCRKQFNVMLLSQSNVFAHDSRKMTRLPDRWLTSTLPSGYCFWGHCKFLVFARNPSLLIWSGFR